MENFTPVTATIGGILIGISAVMLMAFNGRIAGISGVLSGSIFMKSPDKAWRIAFVAGLLLAPLIYSLMPGRDIEFDITSSLPLLIGGGFLVGLGTRLGSGCTSGHGVCGLSRLSPRSVASVVLFMGLGMLTVAMLRGLGL